MYLLTKIKRIFEDNVLLVLMPKSSQDAAIRFKLPADKNHTGFTFSLVFCSKQLMA